MIEDTMLEAANTMKAAADEIVRLRREREYLVQTLADIEMYQKFIGNAVASARSLLEDQS